jgi:hypothetical protein
LSIGPKANINSFKQKPRNSFDSSLECSLASILRSFSDCEKDITQFINKKVFQWPIVSEPGYEVGSEIDIMRRDKHNNKMAAMKLL